MATPIDKVYSLTIGVQGENAARVIEFDMSAWVELYPDAAFHVLFKPYNALTVSPMLSTFEDNILTWTPTLGATAVVGVGYTEIRALDPNTGLIRKTRIIPTSVEHSVSGADENPPQPYADWVNRILEAGSDAVNGAAAVAAVSQGEEVAFEIDEDGHLNIVYTESGESQTVDLGPVDAYAVAVAEGYTGTREEWGQAVADAEANGLISEGYAVGKQHGTDVESGEYYQNNAKYYNEQAQSAKEDAEAAQTAAESAQTAAETAQTSAEASAAEAAQYTSTAVHTWLENNIDPATGYALDRTLTESLAAAPADMAGDLKAALDFTKGQTRNLFTNLGVVIGLVNNSGNVVGASGRTSEYIPVEAGKRYLSTVNNLPSAFRVIAFFSTKSSAGYLSRLVSTSGDITWWFTAPENCNYVRVCTVGNSFEETQSITKDMQLLPYIPNEKQINTYRDSDGDLLDLQLKVNGIYSVFDKIKLAGIINPSNKWEGANSPVTNTHILIPIKENDSIEILASDVNTNIALLKSAYYKTNDYPDFVYQYKLMENDLGEQWWEVVTDGQGNPVSDTRRIIEKNKLLSIIASPDSAYLYITTTYEYNGVTYNSLPSSLKINGTEYIKQAGEREEEYSTVFFDDFDTLNIDVWKFHTEEPFVGIKGPSTGYMSRFYTNNDNVWVEESMLVMKIGKDMSGEHGNYIDGNGNQQPIRYIAPYISTCDSYVIPNGRISARIKTSKPLSKVFFPWCFWTYGQNAAWGYAHEMDVIEVIQDIISQDTTSKSGTLIPAGSLRSTLGFHLHCKDDNGNNFSKVTYKEIAIAKNNSGTIGDDEIFYLKGDRFSTDEWHTYSVEWNKEDISVMIDDNVLCSYNASKIGAVDENGNIGFIHPQDIRFNLKCTLDSSDDEGYLYIDWVKAELLEKTPCISIYHDNVSLTNNQLIYVKPTFNDGCSNKAFEMETDDTDIIELIKYNNDTSQMVVHQIKAIATGTATVKIKSANGKVENTFTVTVSS